MKAQCKTFLCFVTALYLGCAAHTNLHPVGKGKVHSNISFGGPIIAAFGARIPAPYVTVGSNYGLSGRVNIHGNLHLTSLPYRVGGLDFGATWFPLTGDGNSLSVGLQPRVLALASFKSGVSSRYRFYPMLSSSAAGPLGKGQVYVGFNFVVPVSSQDYDDDAAKALFSPFLGYRWQLGSRTRLLTEIKWHGANVESDQLATTYLHPGGRGAITTLFSLERSF